MTPVGSEPHYFKENFKNRMYDSLKKSESSMKLTDISLQPGNLSLLKSF